MRVRESWDPQAAVDHGVALARAAYSRLDAHGSDGLGVIHTHITNHEGSFLNRVTKRVIIGVGGEDATGPHGRLSTVENTIHEVSHKWFDSCAGFLGLVSAGQSGALSEGLAQVMAGAALVLGGTADEQEWGWMVLDPHGQTAIIQRPFGRPSMRVPLSTTMADVHRIGFTLVDAGYIHVHAGVVQAAHEHDVVHRISNLGTGDGRHRNSALWERFGGRGGRARGVAGSAGAHEVSAGRRGGRGE